VKKYVCVFRLWVWVSRKAVAFHGDAELVTGTAADAVDVLKLTPSGEYSENGVVTFDGRSVSLDVKQQDVFGAGGLASQFTISTWMRHEHGDDDQVKQHVMCSSDAEG